MPSPMRQELKAAIERVLAYACLSSRLQDAKACDIVRAYLETFDAEQDFMEVALCWLDANGGESEDDAYRALKMAYRRLVAKREGK